MAAKSGHEKIDGGQESHPAYKPLHRQEPVRVAHLEIHDSSAPFDAPGEREALLAHLFQVSSDGIVLHELLPSPPQGRFIDVNDRMCQMLGYPRVEVLKLTLFEILGEEAREAIPETLRRLRKSGRLLFETTLIRKDGQPVPVEVSVDTLEFRQRRMTLTVVRDITERRRLQEQADRCQNRLQEEVRTRTEELRDAVDRLQEEMGRRALVETELRKRSQMLEAFFRDTITPLAFLDRHFNFVRVNEAYAHAAGKNPEYFVGKNHFTLYPHEETEAIFRQTLRRRQAFYAYARPLIYPDQPERGVTYWDWRLTPLCDDAGEVQFLVLSLDDVTERQNAICQLEQRAHQLQRVTLEMLDAEDRERRRLAEILHDDLQQILAAAKFQLGLLDSRVRSDADLAETVRLVEQMLKDAIEKSRNLSHELGPAVLSQSGLDDTFAWLAHQMQSKHGLVVHVQTRGPVHSPSEPVRMFLYRAAQEILFNVIKHAEVSEAKLRLTRVRNQLRLTISDQGQGFDLRSLTHTAGSGLLSVRERAELLGGRMKIKSATGKGSTFLIAVPDAAVDAGQSMTEAGQSS
ncbi:MAG: PAS domain S-box protein [Planctomycetes bacterium]|nr:PAS domain S-box protein [Planctomycetota bacterium]